MCGELGNGTMSKIETHDCILGIWTDGPYVVITTSVETLDGLWLYKLYVR